MNDTPRVDAIPRRGPFHHYVVEDVLAVARQLERELNQIESVSLRFEPTIIIPHLVERVVHIVGNAQAAQRMLSERDRWRKMAEELARHVSPDHNQAYCVIKQGGLCNAHTALERFNELSKG